MDHILFVNFGKHEWLERKANGNPLGFIIWKVGQVVVVL